LIVSNFFRRLFGKKTTSHKPEALELSTAPLSEEELQPVIQGMQPLEPAQLIVGSAISVGKQRDHNEDTLFTFTATIGGNKTHFPFGIFIIADGMGGHQNGEVASEMAVRAMSSYLMGTLYTPIFGIAPTMPEDSIQEILAHGIEAAHQAVIKSAPGGGTTLTAVVVIGNRMNIAHVGDSRAYAVHLDGRMQVLSRDHSLVKRLEELGQITAEEAEIHPQRNVLYRALGQKEPFEPDLTTAPLPKPGYLLLCSDGLWGVVPDAEMFRLIAKAPSPHRACRNLVEAANAAGGPDNITAILIRMPD